MIVYLFNDTELLKINLPLKISGMYPIYIKNRLVASIVANENKWEIQLSSDFMSNEITDLEKELIVYKVYYLNSTFGQDKYNLIASPKYDETFKIYGLINEGAITLGNNSNCDIYYPYDNSVNGQEILKINFINDNDNKLKIETDSSNFFISQFANSSGVS